MKEIDFLPSWYKKNRRQLQGYRWQYAVIMTSFAFMVSWSFISGKIVNSSSAIEQARLENQNTMKEYEQYKKEIARLSEHRALLEKYESKMNISNILAEISYLVGNDIILSNIEIISDTHKSETKSRKSSVIRTSRSSDGTDAFNNEIFKIVIKGVSSDNNSVADLICQLENSSYFTKVSLGYTKEVSVKQKQVSEFELGCHLANYREITKAAE